MVLLFIAYQVLKDPIVSKFQLFMYHNKNFDYLIIYCRSMEDTAKIKDW